MKSRPKLPALAAALLLAVGPPAFASDGQAPAPPRPYRPNHLPAKVNPQWRSWSFTSKGDEIVYRVAGVPGFDFERRLYLGEDAAGRKQVLLERYKGAALVTRSNASTVAENNPRDGDFAGFYGSQGYATTSLLFTPDEGQESVSALHMENHLGDLLVYSEDVPMGGLVYSKNNATGVVIELARFGRAFEKRPSALSVSIRDPMDFAGLNLTTIYDDEPYQGPIGKDDLGPTVTDGVFTYHEGPGQTPGYFLPPEGAKPTTALRGLGYLTESGHISPREAVYYSIRHRFPDDREKDYEIRKRVRVVVRGNAHYLVETVYDASGAFPAETRLDQPAVRRFDPSEFSLADWPAYDAGEKTARLGNAEKTLREYWVLEGPVVERSPLPGGGQKVEVLRRVHEFDLGESGLDLAVGLWRTNEYRHFQELGADGAALGMWTEKSFRLVERLRSREPAATEDVEDLRLAREFARAEAETSGESP